MNKWAKIIKSDENKKMQMLQDAMNSVHLMNINEDPLLTGYVRHIIEEGDNYVGWDQGEYSADVKIGGLGVDTEHAMITNDGGRVVLKPHKNDPQKFKSIINGELVESQTHLNHGDKVLFGKNLFVIIFPGEGINEDELNYEECMWSMLKD